MSRIEWILLASTDPDGCATGTTTRSGRARNVDGFLELGVGVLVDGRDDVAERRPTRGG